MEILAKIGLAVPVTIGNQITKGINLIAGKEIGKTTTIKEASETKFGKVLGTAITGVGAATAIAAVGASATATAAVSKLGSKVVTTSSKVLKGAGNIALKTAKDNPITTLIAAPIIYGAVKENPKEAANVLIKTPENLANFGSNVSDLAKDPSLEQVQETFKENPVISTILPLIGLGVGAKTILPAITSFENTQAIKEQTQTIKDQTLKTDTNSVIPTTANQIQTIPATTGSSPAAASPVLPQTQTLTATTGSSSTKRKKSARKALQSKISQSVRVNVVGVSSANRITKKYLNTIALRN